MAYLHAVYFRYDYEGVESAKADQMMTHLQGLIAKQTLKGTKYGVYVVERMDNFSYTDPVDGSVSNNQVMDFILVAWLQFLFQAG